MAVNMGLLNERITYSICINSNNRLAGGTNNNCSFSIPWVTILPDCYDNYKVVFNFQSIGGNYKDTSTSNYSSAKLYVDFGSRNYQYDTNSNGPANSLGILSRDIQSTTSTSNCFTAFFYQNSSKTISRPVNNQVNIQIINNSASVPLVNTDASGTAYPDMTIWSLYLEFIPIPNEVRSLIK